MTPEEQLKAENTFIRLYNQGQEVEDIAKQLGVGVSLVKNWQKNLKKALKNYKRPGNLDVSINRKDEDGKYIYQNSINFTVSSTEKMKFDFWQLSRASSHKPEFIDLVQKAKEYLIFIERYLLNFDFDFNGNKGITYNYELSDDSPEIAEEFREIVSFYASFFLQNEYKNIEYTLIQKSSRDIFSDYNKILSYGIKRIIIKSYQEIKFCEISNIPIDTSWIFISGNNGYGKSTFLRAIAISFLGNIEDDHILTNDHKVKIGIECKNKSDDMINNLWSRNFNTFENLVCYGPSRLLIQAKANQNEIVEKSTTSYSLFNSDGVLLNIEAKLIEWHLEENERFDQVKLLFQEVIPSLANILVQKNNQADYEVLYIEVTEENKEITFDPVPFNQLAAGFRSVIGLVGDLLIRFIRKQPHVKQLRELAGIAIIDELENHLHPKWQYQLPTLLSKVFPNIQFIAATHSVIPILGAPKNSVFLKLDRSKEKGITVERIDIDVANLLPNSILTSPIFDMDTIRPVANEDIGKLRTKDTYEEVVANNDVDRQLRELDNDPSQYPALLQE